MLNVERLKLDFERYVPVHPPNRTAASGEREGAGTRYAELENGLGRYSAISISVRRKSSPTKSRESPASDATA